MRSRGVERGPVRVTGGKLRRMRAITSTGVGYLQDHYLRPSPLHPPLAPRSASTHTNPRRSRLKKLPPPLKWFCHSVGAEIISVKDWLFTLRGNDPKSERQAKRTTCPLTRSCCARFCAKGELRKRESTCTHLSAYSLIVGAP